MNKPFTPFESLGIVANIALLAIIGLMLHNSVQRNVDRAPPDSSYNPLHF